MGHDKCGQKGHGFFADGAVVALDDDDEGGVQGQYVPGIKPVPAKSDFKAATRIGTFV